MNKILLWLAMLPSGLWESMGADKMQLNAILFVKLKMDDRRPLSLGRQSGKKRKSTSLMATFLSAVMGFLILTIFYMIDNTIMAMFSYFTGFVFLLSFMLITDFSNVLVNTKDNIVLFPRPISDKTLVLARLLHIFTYLLRTVLPMSLPGWVAVGLQFGWKSVVWFPVVVLLMVFMVLFIVNGVYLLLLKLLKPEKFKKALSYFQIVFSIFVFAFSYVRQLADNSGVLTNVNWAEKTWLLFTPSYWLAATWSWLGAPVLLPGTKMIAICAFAVPLLCLWITIRFLAPMFSSTMAIIGASADNSYVPEKRAAQQTKQKGVPFYMRLNSLVNRSSESKAGFTIAWLQTSRNSTFKVRVYPTFAYAPVFMGVFLFKGGSLKASLELLPTQTFPMLMLLYICTSLCIIQSVAHISHSDQFKASWVYYAAPITQPGKIMAGAFKAVMIKYILPYLLIVFTIILSIWKWQALPDILLGALNLLVYAVSAMMLNFRQLPFSQPEMGKDAGAKTSFRMFLNLFLMGGFMLFHWVATFHWSLKLIFSLLSFGFLWLVWDSFRNTSWQLLKKAED